jgi:four helix bundle protein
MGQKINSFYDLDAWKEGHQIVLKIYKLTESFPQKEMFGLVSQMRRCAVSITSNLAEGFSRSTYRDKAQFYSISLGSLTELQNQLLISRDIKFISSCEYDEILQMTIKTHKIINGLIKASKVRFS